MAEEFALDLEELRHLHEIAKRPRILSLLTSEIRNLEKVNIPFRFYSFLFPLIISPLY